VEFFGTLSKEWALDCMKELLLVNMRGNLQIIVQVWPSQALDMSWQHPCQCLLVTKSSVSFCSVVAAKSSAESSLLVPFLIFIFCFLFGAVTGGQGVRRPAGGGQLREAL